MKKKDAGVMKRSITGDHGRMMMINKSKASDPDISHSSIFINLSNGGSSSSSSSSSSTDIDTPELALSSSVFIESDGDGDDDYCSFRGLVLDLSYRYVFDQ
jgi:cellulase/cellobiase CelA1